MTAPAAAAMPPVPVTLLTGFLGAGKTTLLNRLLKSPGGAGTGVVVNEFGEVGLDGALLTQASAGGGVIELAGGCLCCAVRGELVDTLARLGRDMAEGRAPRLARLVVETSGLADPAPVAAALVLDAELSGFFRLDAVICVLDARSGGTTLAERAEARRQAALADLAVLAKADVAEAPARTAAIEAFRAINPVAPVVPGAAAPARILGEDAERGGGPAFVRLLAAGPEASGTGPGGPGAGGPAGEGASPPSGQGGSGEAGGHHHHSGHHPGAVGSVSIRHREPLAEGAAIAFAQALAALLGPRLLRFKALVLSRETPERPLVLHAVGPVVEAPERLPAWPAGAEPASRFVAIGENLSERRVLDLFAAFAGLPAIDAPDRAALEANPLAVANLSFR